MYADVALGVEASTSRPRWRGRGTRPRRQGQGHRRDPPQRRGAPPQGHGRRHPRGRAREGRRQVRGIVEEKPARTSQPIPARSSGAHRGRVPRGATTAPSSTARCTTSPRAGEPRLQHPRNGLRRPGRPSATGVAFTRDPSTGERLLYGEWLPNARRGRRRRNAHADAPEERRPKSPDDWLKRMPDPYARLVK